MDGLEFTSKVIEAVAWPGTIVVLVFKFSDRFRDLLGKLTEVTLPGGISGKFEAPLRKAEYLREQIQLDFGDDVDVEVEDVPETDPVALSANPTGVIMEAWKELNLVGADLVNSSDLSVTNRLIFATAGPTEIVNLLIREKQLPDAEVHLLRELQQIRNRAAHSVRDRPTPDDAERFLSLVHSLKLAWLGRISAAGPRK
ncbi:hypothetical protein [Burkholderia ambifaria]|uniref:hypothetical protein n=1 Tax=Burkholderia ambifaria TaxID=152480 RepID=UPI00158A174F|nr:hypothetical protein [Burkholderia ambifaria]